MYCNYYKSDRGGAGSFSLSIDADEAGIELLTVMKNTIKRQLTEAINLDKFDNVRELLRIAKDIEDALEEKNEVDQQADARE